MRVGGGNDSGSDGSGYGSGYGSEYGDEDYLDDDLEENKEEIGADDDEKIKRKNLEIIQEATEFIAS